MLVGFKKRFKEPILMGTKVFTLRKRRKIQPKIGEKLYMYTALRTKYSELITNKENLISIQNVRILIEFKADPSDFEDTYRVEIYVDRRKLERLEIKEFAIYDGFKDVFDFCNHWLTDQKGKKKTRTAALLQQFHWTDLRY